MKPVIILFGLGLILGSCVNYDPEPVYDERDKFIGYYSLEEYSRTFNEYYSYEIRITKSRYQREILIDNFYGLDNVVVAHVINNSIEIPTQIVNGYEIEGSGRMYWDEIELSYRVRDLHHFIETDYCEATAYEY